MPPKANQVVASKMRKTKIYEKNPAIRPFIPETLFLTNENLEYMTRKYSKVIFKPNVGERGMYVGSITKHNNLFNIHYLTDYINGVNLDEVYNFITSLSPRKRFLVQQGILLFEYNNRPADVRVVVQKPYRQWMVTGYIARIAAENKMVTNLDSGGIGMPFHEFISKTHYNKQQVKNLVNNMSRISKSIAISLGKRYLNVRELGVDFGVDKSLYPWILEVNTSPGFWRFKYFKDKTLYNRLINYHNIISKYDRYREIPRMEL